MIDLHSHSTASDGTLSPAELITLAKEVGLTYFAITDHDTLAGYLAIKDDPLCQGLHLVAGVEISTRHLLGASFGKHKDSVQTVHVLGLAIKDSTKMQQALQCVQQARATRGRQMIEKLATLLTMDAEALWQTALTHAGGNSQSLGRVHIAQALCQLEVVDSPKKAFDVYLGDNKCAYVALQTLTMAQAVALIHDCGGFAVLAHPTRYGLSATRIRRLIADFAAMGGDGCELPQDSEPLSTRQMIDRTILAHGLLVSVGSDFHGAITPWRRLGQVPTLAAGQVGVWQKF